MSLHKELSEWDMKSADIIAGIYDRHAGNADFPDQIVKLMGNRTLQRGTTWLLKRYFEKNGDPLDEHLVNMIYGYTDRLEHWEAKLHILQCMSWLVISENQLQRVEAFVRNNLVSEMKFVRAWAYSGFYQLAVQYPQFQIEANRLFKDALETETAGSVKSRIRRVIKQGF